MAHLPDLVDGWETLQVAASHRDRQVQSVLRLTKQLAFLQREGFPIPIRFRNIDMGPASLDVRHRARAAESQGLLRITTTPKAAGLREREDFLLTDRGEAYVREELMPAFQELPRGKLYFEVFADVMSRVRFAKNDDMVQEIHRALHLDDPDQFYAAFIRSKEALDTRRRLLDDTWNPREKMDLTAAAAVELGSQALERLVESVADAEDTSTGKHNIVWNCERLAELLEIKESLDPSGRAARAGLERAFERVLNALEVNAEVYGVLHIPTDEEIEAMMKEAGASDPNEATS
jgi:hypothetical protein